METVASFLSMIGRINAIKMVALPSKAAVVLHLLLIPPGSLQKDLDSSRAYSQGCIFPVGVMFVRTTWYASPWKQDLSKH